MTQITMASRKMDRHSAINRLRRAHGLSSARHSAAIKGFRAAAQLVVGCDMKLHSVLLGWSDPDQALRVAAGTPRKHASDGRGPSGRYCQGYEAFPVM